MVILTEKVQTEKEVQTEIFRTLNTRPDTRVFRNNVGVAKIGKHVIRYGLCNGSSDLIGWTKVRITPEMVGQDVAIFTAYEIKKNDGTPSQEQINFLTQVVQAGGFANWRNGPDKINYQHSAMITHRQHPLRKHEMCTTLTKRDRNDSTRKGSRQAKGKTVE